MQQLHFHVYMENPDTHTFKIEMHIPAIAGSSITVALPVWTPGSYLVREYAKNINALNAFQDGHQIRTTKTDKCSWEIFTNGAACVVKYDLYAFEESVRTCWLDALHASIIPAGMFLRIADIDTQCVVQIHPHSSFADIVTSLPEVNGNKWMRFAADLDTLYDSPMQIGNPEIYNFSASGIPHALAITGKGNYNAEQIIADSIKVIETELRIFQHHPCPAYLTILNLSNTLRGGLEHKESTSLIFKRLMFNTREGYLEYISLFAHEYFHLWNVKRLRPKALGPFNYHEENYTTGLWIAEGFTSYYDDLIVYRAGIYTESEYIKVLEKNVNQAENAPGKKVQSVADASFDAWIKYYRQNENSDNNQVNYYVRGSVLATLLDIIIIHNSGAQYCLDDVMRTAYHQFYIERNTGFTEDEFKAVLEKYAGTDLTAFYTDHVFGTKQLNLQYYFNLVGMQLTNTLEAALEADLGLSINERNTITNVRKNSAGERGGLNVQDEIIAINDYRFTPTLLNSLMMDAEEGTVLQFVISRQGIIAQKTVRVQLSDKVAYTLTKHTAPNAEQQRNYLKWLAVTPA